MYLLEQVFILLKMIQSIKAFLWRYLRFLMMKEKLHQVNVLSYFLPKWILSDELLDFVLLGEVFKSVHCSLVLRISVYQIIEVNFGLWVVDWAPPKVRLVIASLFKIVLKIIFDLMTWILQNLFNIQNWSFLDWALPRLICWIHLAPYVVIEAIYVWMGKRRLRQTIYSYSWSLLESYLKQSTLGLNWFLIIYELKW